MQATIENMQAHYTRKAGWPVVFAYSPTSHEEYSAEQGGAA